MPSATIVIPTRERLPYLQVALESVSSALAALSERDMRTAVDVLVLDDGGDSPQTRAVVERLGARYEAHPRPGGLNAARNTAAERSDGELLVFIDDDVRVGSGWLQALLDAADAHPEIDVFTGPIIARLEGRAPRTCGREAPPITALDLGHSDTDARFAWGANMTIRRSALARIGPFDATIPIGGDEQEWQERMREREPGARILYVAGAAIEHRRAGADARLRALSAATHARGRSARRFDAARGRAPSLARELLTLAGCAGHVLRHRCPAGLTMVAHSVGRLREGIRERITEPSAAAAPAEDFLSGSSGTVGGKRAVLLAAGDAALDARLVLGGTRRAVRRAAREQPPRLRVLALTVLREQHRDRARRVHAELARSRHALELDTCEPGELGKFANLNLLLGRHRVEELDWVLLVDDDVDVPRGFLDSFLFLAEHYGLALAQPAHRLASHAAWSVTRRQAGVLARETGFVEIGPVTAIGGRALRALLPFPDVQMGWGLELHWSAVAEQQAWRCGIVDATPIAHLAAPAASTYSRERAIEEARGFLGSHPYVPAPLAARTLTTYRRL